MNADYSVQWLCPYCGGEGLLDMPETHARIIRVLRNYPEEGLLTSQLAERSELCGQSISNLNNKLHDLRRANCVARTPECDPSGGRVYRWKVIAEAKTASFVRKISHA